MGKVSPAFFALLLTPLIIGVKPVVFGTQTIVDIYSWYKAAFLIILGAIAFYQRRPPIWFVAAIAISCLVSKFPDMAWWGFPEQYFGGVVFIALFALAVNPPSEKRVTDALTWGSIPVSLLAIFPHAIPWSWIVGGYTPRFLGNSHAGTLENVNYVGLYASMVLPVLFASRKRWDSLVALLLLTVALYFSGSLGGTVGAGTGVLFLIAEKNIEKAVCLAIPALGLLAYKWKPDLGGRVEIWRNTLPLLNWHGSGLAAFPLEYPQVAGSELGYVDKPHSMYLQVVHAFGYVGAGLGATSAAIWAWRPRSVPLTAGLVGGLTAGIANDLYVGVAPILFILFTASVKTQEKKECPVFICQSRL